MRAWLAGSRPRSPSSRANPRTVRGLTSQSSHRLRTAWSRSLSRSPCWARAVCGDTPRARCSRWKAWMPSPSGAAPFPVTMPSHPPSVSESLWPSPSKPLPSFSIRPRRRTFPMPWPRSAMASMNPSPTPRSWPGSSVWPWPWPPAASSPETGSRSCRKTARSGPSPITPAPSWALPMSPSTPP